MGLLILSAACNTIPCLQRLTYLLNAQNAALYCRR